MRRNGNNQKAVVLLYEKNTRDPEKSIHNGVILILNSVTSSVINSATDWSFQFA